MSVAILRDGNVLDVAVTTSASTTEAIDLRRFHRGIIVNPSGSSITEVSYLVSDSAAGTYVGGAGNYQLAADSYIPIDDYVMCAPYVKIVGDASGTVQLFLKG